MILLATPAQARQLAALEATQPHAAGWKEKGFQTELTQPHAQIWVHTRMEEITGFLALRSVGDFAEILNVAVSPLYTRQGIARTLLNHALAQLAEKQVKQVSLEVAQDNPPAIALYTQAGFQVLGKRKDFYAPGRDGLIMGKDL